MTPELLEKIKRHRTLLPRLDAGDDLHKEAAVEIRRIQKMYNDDMREEQRAAQGAYQDGRWDERESSGDF